MKAILGLVLIAALWGEGGAMYWTLTAEFHQYGIGNTTMRMVEASEGSFCFLVKGHSWYKSGESCILYVQENYWVMQKTRWAKT